MADQNARIDFRCPSCRKAYAVKLELAGKSAKCVCGAKCVIPNVMAPSGFTTELVLATEGAAPADADDEYEIEPPIPRPAPDTVRRATNLAAELASPSPDKAIPPRAVNRSLPDAGGSSRTGSFLLALILLVIVSAGASLWAGISVGSSISAFSTAYQKLPLPQSLHAGRVRDEQTQVERAIGAFALTGKINLLLGVIATTAYLVWIYQAHSRLKQMRVANLRFTPGWAVGYHFVPFWNLIRPYQVMREIWHGSDPAGEGVNDCSGKSVRSSWLVRSWWIALLALIVVGFSAALKTQEVRSKLPPRPNVRQSTESTLRIVQTQQVRTLFVIAYFGLLGSVAWSTERRQAARLGAANIRKR